MLLSGSEPAEIQLTQLFLNCGPFSAFYLINLPLVSALIMYYANVFFVLNNEPFYFHFAHASCMQLSVLGWALPEEA